MTSLWWDTLPEHLTTPLGEPLTGEADADVVIVGAGYTGLWTAYYLLNQEPGIRVTLLEAEHAGFGASGRNGGWCSALFPASVAKVAGMSDRESAIRLQRAMHDTVDDIGRVSESEGWDIQWAKGGTIVAARTPLQWQRAQEEIAEWRRWGFGEEDYRLLDAEEAGRLLTATDVIGASYTPHCAAIHPARLVRHLAKTVVERGGVIHEHSPVTEMRPGFVRTPRGRVRARHVVRATSSPTPGAVPSASRATGAPPSGSTPSPAWHGRVATSATAWAPRISPGARWPTSSADARPSSPRCPGWATSRPTGSQSPCAGSASTWDCE